MVSRSPTIQPKESVVKKYETSNAKYIALNKLQKVHLTSFLLYFEIDCWDVGNLIIHFISGASICPLFSTTI